MNFKKYNILLADDDADDRLFFKEALEELPFASVLQTVDNGEMLMNLLTTKPDELPDILFLDLNMPRKTGQECLYEIKQHHKLKELPVVIYSTSPDASMWESLFKKGATHYIRKPGDFNKLKSSILDAINDIFNPFT